MKRIISGFIFKCSESIVSLPLSIQVQFYLEEVFCFCYFNQMSVGFVYKETNNDQ